MLQAHQAHLLEQVELIASLLKGLHGCARWQKLSYGALVPIKRRVELILSRPEYTSRRSGRLPCDPAPPIGKPAFSGAEERWPDGCCEAALRKRLRGTATVVAKCPLSTHC